MLLAEQQTIRPEIPVAAVAVTVVAVVAATVEQ